MQEGHAWLAQHYKWGLDRAFIERQHSHVIIVEDDMLFSPDFLRYFEAMAVLLERDSSLFCISAWNDNGRQEDFEWSPHRMFRTSYFPGLASPLDLCCRTPTTLVHRAKLISYALLCGPCAGVDDYTCRVVAAITRSCLRQSGLCGTHLELMLSAVHCATGWPSDQWDHWMRLDTTTAGVQLPCGPVAAIFLGQTKLRKDASASLA